MSRDPALERLIVQSQELRAAAAAAIAASKRTVQETKDLQARWKLTPARKVVPPGLAPLSLDRLAALVAAARATRGGSEDRLLLLDEIHDAVVRLTWREMGVSEDEALGVLQAAGLGGSPLLSGKDGN